ncbi:unnamed protein product [Linum trigynum]|uniref:RNase H type-1 domain-containing protein n=1 Tax=Linum trigynum TaxID=586398 RepID=A0AAV2ECA6_9ROSI
MGVIVRDYEGRFILAAAKRVKGSFDPACGEAMVVELGLFLAKQHELGDVVVETDCSTVVKCVREPLQDQTELGVICRNINRELGLVGDGSIQHVSRDANEATDIMVHVETWWDEMEVWLD